MLKAAKHPNFLVIAILSLFATQSVLAKKSDSKTKESEEQLPPVVVHEGRPFIIVSIIDETERGGNFSHQATSNDEFPSLSGDDPRQPSSGLSARIVDWRIEPDTLREQVLHRAFDKALKRSKLRYVYSMVHEDLPRKQWVPQLNIRISDWQFRVSGAAECIADAAFYDASGTLHDLKGSIGFESTDGMTSDRYDLEAYLERSAQYAFEKVLRNIKKKRLYREPDPLPPAKKSKKEK